MAKTCDGKKSTMFQVGSSPCETSLGLLLSSPGLMRSDWLGVKNAKKAAGFKEAEKNWRKI